MRRAEVAGRYPLIMLSIFAIIALSLGALFIPFSTITGRTVSTAVVLGSLLANCSTPLVPGWNLVSMACRGADTTRAVMLSDIDGLYESVHAYDASDATDPWKSYNPNLPAWVIQDLSDIDDKKGYWINSYVSTYWDVSGIIKYPQLVTVYTGWNLVGYPKLSGNLANASLFSLYPYWREVQYYNATTGLYYHYYNATQQGNFTRLEPGLGYWLYTGAGTWTVQ